MFRPQSNLGNMKISDLQVIYEDNHLIAVNKPAGVLVHGDHTEDITLIDVVKQFVKVRYKKPGEVFLGLVHRIDRPVSGVVIFARTSKALSRMNELIKDRKIEKSYLALVGHRPKKFSDKLEHFIFKNVEKNRANISKKSRPGYKPCSLSYELSMEIEGKCLLNINLHTGRSHQIRAQLNYIGCPIVGDIKYGYPTKLLDRSICLHSHSMKFIHPVKKEEVHITVDPPSNQFWDKFTF